MIQEQDLQTCPEVVIRYLKKSGVVGQTRRNLAHIIHAGEFRLKPTQRWLSIKGEYKFNPEAAEFVWDASIKFFPLINISVRDEYRNGIGRSLVRLKPLFTIADQTGPEINESSLGRLLIEMVLIPTALVPNENLSWEPVDATHARVVFTNHGLRVAADFEFSKDDLPVKTSIQRFGNFDGIMKKNLFVCEMSQFEMFEGLLIPTNIKGGWDFLTETFYWFRFLITKVHYE